MWMVIIRYRVAKLFHMEDDFRKFSDIMNENSSSNLMVSKWEFYHDSTISKTKIMMVAFVHLHNNL